MGPGGLMGLGSVAPYKRDGLSPHESFTLVYTEACTVVYTPESCRLLYTLRASAVHWGRRRP
jgi:hypothetical protein